MLAKPTPSQKLIAWCHLAGLADGLDPEHQFCERRWRLDLAWPAKKLAVEIEGGIWTRGRHTRPRGFLGDMEKYNRLAVLGWCLLRFTPQEAASGKAVRQIEEWFRGER